jgi:hypothetical protein
MQGYFVEDCIAISPNSILQHQHIHEAITHWYADGDKPASGAICLSGGIPQMLSFEWQEITYGKRAFFVCDCGSKVGKLYLPPHGKEFLCRKCHQLRYFLATINRQSVAGRSIYRMNRLRKLSESRAQMGRIFYNGEYTKRFCRFLSLCSKAGLNHVVEGAEQLKTVMNP